LVNGEKNNLQIHLQNHGTRNYTLVSAASSFHDTNKHWATVCLLPHLSSRTDGQVKNATALRYNVPLVAGANFSAPYTVHSEFRPQELGLTVWVNLVEQGTTNTLSQVTALNQTISIVEPASSWLDPSLLFLWLVLGSALVGGAYAVYNSYFAPQTKKGKRTGVKKSKAVVVNEKTEDYPNVKPYEEEWIPAQHLKSRTSKLKKRDTGASSGGEELTSGGEVTSGAESATEGKGGKKRKNKKA